MQYTVQFGTFLHALENINCDMIAVHNYLEIILRKYKVSGRKMTSQLL